MQASAIAGKSREYVEENEKDAKELEDISKEFFLVHQADGYLSAPPRSKRHSHLRGLSEEYKKRMRTSKLVHG